MRFRFNISLQSHVPDRLLLELLEDDLWEHKAQFDLLRKEVDRLTEFHPFLEPEDSP